jgi:hypothetical protein
MDKETCLNKIDEMIPDLVDFIHKKAKSYLNSGAINIEDFEDDYLLPKIIMSAVGKEIQWQYKPLTKKYRDLADELYNY